MYEVVLQLKYRRTQYNKLILCNLSEHGKRPFIKQGGTGRGVDVQNRADHLVGANRLRPGLRTTCADGGRTSQGLEHCPSRPLASLFQALPIRGSPSICVTRSKIRPQAIWPHEICRLVPKTTPRPSRPVPK